MRSYEDLRVYQESYGLMLEIYPETRAMPVEERFGLAQQIRGSAVSICSNIAEGSGRATTGEYANAVSIASGSAAELEVQLRIARDLNMMQRDEVDGFLKRLTRIRRELHAFHRFLKTNRQ